VSTILSEFIRGSYVLKDVIRITKFYCAGRS
jgi:hypothetical protein